MQLIPVVGGMLGYLVACLFSGHLLPVLSVPSIIGVVGGGVIALVIAIASGWGNRDIY
jgi:hypothetical protein